MVAIYHITTSMKNKLNISTSKVRGDFSTRFVGITQLFSFNRISAFTHTDIEEFIFKILPTSYRIFFFFFFFLFSFFFCLHFWKYFSVRDLESFLCRRLLSRQQDEWMKFVKHTYPWVSDWNYRHCDCWVCDWCLPQSEADRRFAPPSEASGEALPRNI